MNYIVTPYCQEDVSVLLEAHRSAISQDVDVVHVMVADGFPRADVQAWNCEHISLPKPHRDGGSLARGIGALHAFSCGAQHVFFLDADNWLEPNHVSTLLSAARSSGALVAASCRSLRRLDGSLLTPLDPESDGERFADTSTLMISRGAIGIAALWTILPANVGAACDRFIWEAVKRRNIPRTRTNTVTSHFRTRYSVHYSARGENPPVGTINLDRIIEAKQNWLSIPENERNKILNGSA